MKNPAMLMRLKRDWEGFCKRHPKMLRYIAYVSDNYMNDGTVVDITVINAEGKAIHGNARLTAEDAAFLQQIRALLVDDKK